MKIYHRLKYFNFLKKKAKKMGTKEAGYPIIGVLGCMAERLKNKLLEVMISSLNRTVLYRTVLYRTVLYYTVLYCTVLYCTVLYCTVLKCTVLHFTVGHYIYQAQHYAV